MSRPGTDTNPDTLGPTIAGMDPSMVSSMEPKERLMYELEIAAGSEPPETFCGKYILVSEQASGTQGVVNFARSERGGVEQFAIKFFIRGKVEYDEEVGLYERPELRNLLPELLMHSENADRSLRSRSGFTWPPFMVMERGVTLNGWLSKRPRAFAEILHMFGQLATLLAGLHKAGFVHRDIKPDNALYLLNSSGVACLRAPASAPPHRSATRVNCNCGLQKDFGAWLTSCGTCRDSKNSLMCSKNSHMCYTQTNVLQG
jgi:serine/threonine protein kinase